MHQPDVNHVNEIVRRFGESQRAGMRAERRESMRSMLFDLPRRSSLGWECLHEHGAHYLRELCESLPPEEIGRRMRVPGSRPYALQPFIVLCSYLGARQQRILDRGIQVGDAFPEEDVASMCFLTDFWERVMRAYRSDGRLLPDEAGGALGILNDAQVTDLAERLAPFDAGRYAAVRRTGAILDLYSFILHGEQRDGIFGHGPYPGPRGSTLFVKEWNDLCNDYLPWAATRSRIPVANVVVVYAANDVEIVCDMFGSMTVHPHELGDRLVGLVALTSDAGVLRELDDAEMHAIQETATSANEELYLRALEWDDRYKIEYGAALFANHLTSFFSLAGDDTSVRNRIMQSCRATAERMGDRLLGAEVPSIWSHMATGDADFFSPVVR